MQDVRDNITIIIEKYLDSTHASTFGRQYDLVQPDSRAACIAFIKKVFIGILDLADEEVEKAIEEASQEMLDHMADETQVPREFFRRNPWHKPYTPYQNGKP